VIQGNAARFHGRGINPQRHFNHDGTTRRRRKIRARDLNLGEPTGPVLSSYARMINRISLYFHIQTPWLLSWAIADQGRPRTAPRSSFENRRLASSLISKSVTAHRKKAYLISYLGVCTSCRLVKIFLYHDVGSHRIVEKMYLLHICTLSSTHV
jgi:hypothetical protein